MKQALLAACLVAAATACTPAPQPPPQVQPPVPPPPPAAAPAPASVPDAPVPAAPPETWVLPGTLGPLTTRAELERRFGKANLRDESFPGAEGIGTYPVLVAYPDDPRRRLELVLDADEPDAPIRELRVSDARTRWHRADGLRPGMTLAQLVALNGQPVSFYGLAWDYGGTVQDWHGGSLANAVGAPVFHRVALGARPSLASSDGLPQGDTVFRSDDRRWPTLGKDIVVGELGISWPDNGD